jgi:cell division protein FtsW (lipid II flippase)
MSLRNRELFYLVIVGILTGIGFASVYIASQSQVSGTSLTYAAFFFALYLVAHLIARYTVPLADPYVLPLAALLTAIGLTEIYRLGPSDAFRQGTWVVIGVAIFALTLIGLRRDYRLLENYKYLFGLGAIALLFMPLLPGIGQTVNGARLWVHAGPLQFQPGELGKIALIVFLAAYFREKREVLAQGRLKDWGPLLVIWGAAMLVLFASDDLGSALLYYGIFLALLYVATARVAFVAVGVGLFLAGAVAVYQGTPHVRIRVANWLQPWTELKVYCAATGTMEFRQDCGSYQEVQSLYSIGHGGFGGTGLGTGTFTTASGHQIIPFLNTDFIYSALAQELGLIGAAGMRPDLRLRAADVHHRRRHPAGDPADRHHAAARLVRRLVGHLELPRARRADARLESGERRARGWGARVNRQLNRLAVVAVLLLAILIGATTYWQAWAAGDLQAKQDNAIQRVVQFTIATARPCLQQIVTRRSRGTRSTSAAIRRAVSASRPSATRPLPARRRGSRSR